MEMIVDLFAGGGGASTGIERALGRSPDIAVNHDDDALACHAMNHPQTLHLQRNVWQVDPLDYVNGRSVGLLWLSPDCKHFSKAKGAAPVKRNIRDLAWVGLVWAKRARPRVIILENVEEFQTWGPVLIDGTPCPDRKGETFKQFVREMKRLGYKVEWRELRACDYGAPTIRKRLFLIARRDGLPIVWPDATHGAPNDLSVIAGRKRLWRTAADCIDWSIPCPSIFLSREEGRAIGVNRPLVDATMARIARGVKRYVIDAAEPFIVPVTHQGDARVHSIHEPMRTQTTANRGEHALVTPMLVSVAHGDSGGRREYPIDAPIGTQLAANQHAVVAAFLAQHNTGVVGRAAPEPLSTQTSIPTHQAIVAATLVNMKGSDNRGGWPIGAPMPTICAGGQHVAEVRAFLIKYYGTDQAPELREPMHTDTTKDRFGLVMVHGAPYEIVDIGMRMLTPRERFRAQGFPESYIIDRRPDGAALTKTAQGRLCGNSVCPDVADALVSANCADMVGARVAA